MRISARAVWLSLSCCLILGAETSPGRAEPVKLRDGDFVAICGDSITEQRMYSVYLETYLLACQPAGRLQAAQFGWGGETAGGFLGRLENDVLGFKPNVATLSYGMNDGGYIPTDQGKLDAYRRDLTATVHKLKEAGVRDVVVGTPNAVDTTTFKSFWGTKPDVYNRTLADFGKAAKEIAEKENVGFADVYGPMIDVMAKLKEKYGRDYVLAGKDGIHPDANGHLVMAYAFLKALGCGGDIGTLTLDMAAGTGTASGGHKILAATKDSLQIESTQYPFCFYGDPAKPESTRGVLDALPFNQELNRLTLVLKNAPAGKLKVTWGTQSKEFDASALTQGINLAAEFLGNPFSEPFKKLQDAVGQQQRYELPAVKEMMHVLPELRKSTPGQNGALDALKTSLIQTDAAMRSASAVALVPVKHEIRVEAVGELPSVTRAGVAPAPAEPVDCVNPLSGTNGDSSFSRGNTIPAIMLPFGITTWSPQTDGSSSWFYTYQAKQFEGIRATHQPSVWIRDYGDFLMMPVVGEEKGSAREIASPFSHAEETARPYYYAATLERYQTRLEMVPTERCTMMRLTFPSTDKAGIVFRTPRGEINLSVDADHRKITGTARHVTFGAPGNFALYFVAEFERPFATTEVWPIQEKDEKDGAVAAVRFSGVKAGEPVQMRVGTSFISFEQAELNLRREVPDWNFDAVRERGKAAWTQELAVAEIAGGTEAQRSTFYTALYRAVQFPRMFHELDAAGKTVHYSPFDGKVHEGPLYTDNGLWDTFRSAFPLLALFYPERDADIMRGWVNAYREGGWLPTWPSPGNRPCMIGSHGDSIVADAYLKGIRGFDAELAYEAARKDATVDANGAWAGRDHLKDYLEKGYVSTDARKDGSAAVTLEYAYDDYCVSRLARALGHAEDAKLFADRAHNYRHVWDQESGFMRGRRGDGSWPTPFDPIEWGGPYVEGNAWQWTWSVMQDPYGLMTLLGGREGTAKKLDEMLAMPSNYKPGSYGGTIHEMRETEASKMGQYAHVNEPCHHLLYFYHYAGQPWKTQFNVRRVMDELYQPDGMVGDEDTGQMSAWYVFNAAGFYPFCPGNPCYLIGSPLFERISLKLANGKVFTVEAKHNSPVNRYIQSARLNGEPLTRTWLAHETVTQGGTLELEMGSGPNKSWGSGTDAAPPDDLSPEMP